MKNLCFTLVCFGFLCSASSQEIDTALAKYASGYLPEKLYIHFDKASYLPGETVWFKAYLMEDLFPGEKSKTVYVDWIGDDGTVLYHTVAPLVGGNTFGQFEIPAETTSDMLHVRAYTKWMLNFDTAFLFKKDIPLLNKNGKTLKAKPAIIPSLAFFPEGGDLVTGVINRVAFKANDQWGIPVKVRGAITDSKGKFIDSIKTVHDGMGIFHILPEHGLSYVVKWKDEKSVARESQLPSAKASGIAMQVMADGTKRIVSINSSNQLNDNLKQLHLVGTMNGQLAFKNEISINPSSSAKRVIPTGALPSGILTLTLFDAGWNAIAERITFIGNNEYSFETSMEVLHWGLSKRKRNEIEIRVPDSLAAADLSISVTDVAVDHDTSDNIISHFLLTSDIKGYVHNPSYYFAGNDEKRKANLDLVLMTNGWRRFKWEEITKGQVPKTAHKRDVEYLSLSGQLMGVTKGQLSGTESLALIIKQKDSSSKLLLMPIKTDGSFNDPEYIFFDSLTVYYSLKSKFLKQAEARFMANRLPAPNYSTYSKGFRSNRPLSDTSGMGYHFNLASREVGLKELERNKILETVYIKAKGKTPTQLLEEKYPSGMFRGTDGFQFDLVNDPLSAGYTSVFMYLQGRVPGLQITPGIEPTLSWRGGSPLLYVDEMRSDASMLNSIPVNDIAYVKVFRPPFMGGSGGGSGAIAIYTRKGDDTRSSSQGLSTNTIAGYTQVRDFYSPNYDRFDPRNEQADVRTTLYWNPRVVTTPGKSSVKLTFYNNDVTKSFRVVIEGVSKTGMLTHFEQIME